VLWAAKGTSYISKHIKAHPGGTYNKKYLVVCGGDHDKIMETINNELLTPATSTDISKNWQVPPRTHNNTRSNLKTIDDDTVYACDIDENKDGFIRAGEYTHPMYTITMANAAVKMFYPHAEGFRWIVQLPKSRWNAKITKVLPNAMPALVKKITDLVKEFHDEIVKLKSLNTLDDNHTFRYLSRWCGAGINSKFTDEAKKYLLPGERFSRLIYAAKELGIPLPDTDPVFIAKAVSFITRYKPIVVNDIDIHTYPELLDAYEQYLEKHTDV
jgi:hypothetical protein